MENNNHLATSIDPLSKDEPPTHHHGGDNDGVDFSDDDFPIRQSGGTGLEIGFRDGGSVSKHGNYSYPQRF